MARQRGCRYLLCATIALLLVAVGRISIFAAQECDPESPAIVAVSTAIFDPSPSCDINGDGAVTAADVTAAVRLWSPTPTATKTPTPTETATATATPTGTLCPVAGADLTVEIDNRTGSAEITVNLSGERVGFECGGATVTSYNETRVCAADEIAPCLELNALAPGSWRHSIRVLEPNTGQTQHRANLLVEGPVPNGLRFTAFATVTTVATNANDGDGSLRKALRDADTAVKPLLIRFDPSAFPPGVPTTIELEFALPTLATDEVTIDGTDETGATGNRIVDARGLPFGALAIAGARNHLIGLHLRNAGAGDRDVLSISGPQSYANLVEQMIIENAASADGIGIVEEAGSDFEESANVVRDCEIRGAIDKGIKVTTGAYARVENCWVHDNINGGMQATLGGHLKALYNLIEQNKGGTAQNGLAANPATEGSPGEFSELVTRGNISRGNGANGISVRGAVADIQDDYLASNQSSGLRVFNDIGDPASARVEGTSAVCNGVDGAVVADGSYADFGGGPGASPGNNAFTQNNLPEGGANLRNATAALISAVNNQWENCGTASECVHDRIADLDLSDHGAKTSFVPAQAHRAQEPVLTRVWPERGMNGVFLRVFGSGFNVIDGHFAEDNCADVSGRNRCVPLRGNCVRIGGVSAPVEAVTPTMLLVRWPFTCIEPVSLVVTVDQGATGADSNPLTVCTNQ